MFVNKVLVSLSFVLIGLRSLLYFLMSVRMAKLLYERLYFSVKNTSIHFFQLNPLNKIMNRFSNDTKNMDDSVSKHIYELLNISCIIISTLVLSILIKYWLVINLIPFCLLFFLLQSYFVSSARELRRLDSYGNYNTEYITIFKIN